MVGRMTDQPDLTEFATIGAKIAEVGTNLNQLRAQRAELDAQIHVHEQELGPLIVRHSELIAALTGKPMPRPQPATFAQLAAQNLGPQHPAGPPVSMLVDGEEAVAAAPDANMPPTYAPISVTVTTPGTPQQEARIRDFLEKCEAGTSSHDVADALKVDSALVRKVMRELVNPR